MFPVIHIMPIFVLSQITPFLRYVTKNLVARFLPSQPNSRRKLSHEQHANVLHSLTVLTSLARGSDVIKTKVKHLFQEEFK